MKKKSNYDFKIIEDYLLIVDNDYGSESAHTSVTNNMEQVLTEILATGVDITKFKIVYRDSRLNWDQVEVKSIKQNIVKYVDFLLDQYTDQEFFDNLFISNGD